MAIQWDDEKPASGGIKWDDAPAAPPPLGQSHASAAPPMASHGPPGVTPREKHNPLMALIQGAYNAGTLNWGDELAGAVGATVDKLKGQEGSWGDHYRGVRDTQRRLRSENKQDHPYFYTTGEVAGGMAPAGGAVSGLKGAASVGDAAAKGMVLGGIAGGGENEDPNALGADVNRGAAFGAAGGALGEGVGVVARNAPRVLQNAGTNWGFRALRARGGDITAKKPLDPEAILAAYEVGAFRPGTTVHFAAKKLYEARQRLGGKVGALEDALSAAGVTGPERAALANEFERDAARLKLNTSANDPRMTQMRDEGLDLRSEIPKPPVQPAPAPNSVPPTWGAQPLPPPPAPPPPSRMTLSQALNKKRSAGDLAEKEFDRVRGQRSALGEGKLNVWGKYKDATEREINAQGPTKAPDAYAQWKPTNKQFSHIAAADEVAAEGSARARGRSWFLNVPNMIGGAGATVATGMATGNPLALLAPLAVHELRVRGPSTATWALLGGSKLAAKAAPSVDTDLAKQLLMSSMLAGGTDGGNQ